MESWKRARKLCVFISQLISLDEFNNDYALISQIRRSSGSVMDNIAEGFERGGNKEFIQYLYIAKGSVDETRSQFYRAHDFNYITEDDFDIGLKMCHDVSKLISGMISYLKKSNLKGKKFN